MSDKNLEQRINIKFCVKISKSASEMLALSTVAYGEYVMKKSSVSEWHMRFKEGREDVQDDPRSGQPKTQRTDANVDRVRTVVRADRTLGVRVIAEELNMNRETVLQIVKEDLGMRRISAKMVPRILTPDQK
jgi:transposase